MSWGRHACRSLDEGRGGSKKPGNVDLIKNEDKTDDLVVLTGQEL